MRSPRIDSPETAPAGAAEVPQVCGGLARYVVAATLARSADGGAVVAIVLLVTTSGSPGWVAGLLGACITAPHLFGPFVARCLDTARDGRTVISLACMAHGVTLAAAVLVYPVAWPAVTGILLVASGLVGPLLTGGISSRLPAIAGPERSSQRRAQGWDVATYGIGARSDPPSLLWPRPGRVRRWRPCSWPEPLLPPRPSSGSSHIPRRPLSRRTFRAPRRHWE